ncbi:MAG: sulfite exporter TauE/SafE family protein [Pseudomonadales bacterium]|nr:sulfite exporter TauE/SafE family protein [Pseudomonadales bacterium]
MNLLHMIIPALAAFLGGFINSVAGGGSFFTFPALLWVGILPTVANASSTVALLPGSLSSAWAYRDDIKKESHIPGIISLLLVSLVGGVVGAFLLLSTAESVFVKLIPWLLLIATLIFMGGKRISNALKNRVTIKKHHILIAQFFISLYGGYFGGGLGILLLAVFSFIGIEDIHTMNGLKTLFSAIINLMASLIFIFTGHVNWTAALPMIVFAILGGLVGPWLARKIPQNTLRMIILIFSSATTVWFFVKTYH